MKNKRRYKFIKHPQNPTWIEVLIDYIESRGFEIPLLEVEETYQKPKRTCKPKAKLDKQEPIPTSNSFETLDTTTKENNQSAMKDSEDSQSPMNDPENSQSAMIDLENIAGKEIKKKMPSITVKTPEQKNIEEIKSKLKEESRIFYMNTKIRIQTSTLEEYKEILKYLEQNKLEFYTFNPLISNISKCVIKGLSPSTKENEIKTELLKKGIQIKHIRQLVKSSQNEEGEWIRKLLPIWILTYDKENQDEIFGLNGLMNYRIIVEELKNKNTITQCYRCQEIGHKAIYCKQKRENSSTTASIFKQIL